MRSVLFFFSSRRRHVRYWRDWSSGVCSSDLQQRLRAFLLRGLLLPRLLRALALLWRLLRLRNGHLLRGRFRGTLRIALAHRRRRSEQHTNSGKEDRKSTRLNSSHANISYAVFCLKKKT